jgi:hypothetical protein
MSMETLDRLGEEYFRRYFAADPFLAGVFGVPGFEADAPDPSRAAGERHRAELARLAAELAAVDRDALTGTDRISHAMLGRLLHDGQRVLADGTAEVAVTAGGQKP